MSATLIQTKSAHEWSTALSVFTLTMDGVTSAGNTLIMSLSASGDMPTSLSDDAGNTWINIASTIDAGAVGQRRGQLWYCLNADPASEIHVSSSGSQNVLIVASEWRGVTGLRSYGMKNTTDGATRVAAEVGDLVFAPCYYYRDIGSPELSPESGWISAGSVVRDTAYQSTAYRTATAGGLQGPLWDINSAGKATITAAFTTVAGVNPGNTYVRVEGVWIEATPHLRVNGIWRS